MRNSVSIVILFLICIVSCKPSLPSGIMTEDQMLDFLYDYHILMADANSNHADSTAFYKKMYFDALLDKYDISEATFDTSMVYYQRHAKELKEVYENINKRFEKYVGQENLLTKDETADYMMYPQKGDSALIWSNRTSEVIFAQPPYNIYSFRIKADSASTVGDVLEFKYQSRFLVENNRRNAFALLSVIFENDSAAYVSSYSTMDGVNTITYKPSSKDSVIVKEIRGFIAILSQNNVKEKRNLNVLNISNVAVIRYHKNVATGKVGNNDGSNGVTNRPPDRLRSMSDGEMGNDTASLGKRSSQRGIDSIGNKKEKRKITYITTKKDKNGNRVISDIKIK